VPKTGQFPKKLVYKFGPLAYGWHSNDDGPPMPSAVEIGLAKRRAKLKAAAKTLVGRTVKHESPEEDDDDEDDDETMDISIDVQTQASP
jgi:hypothetical protein